MKTIKIHDKTHEGLEKLFIGRDTFDRVINRLIVENKFFEDSLNKLKKEEKEKILNKMKLAYEKHL